MLASLFFVTSLTALSSPVVPLPASLELSATTSFVEPHRKDGWDAFGQMFAPEYEPLD